MKKNLLLTALLSFFALGINAIVPDSVYLFIYNTPNDSHKGLHIAYSVDNKNWTAIGRDRSFVTSDFGPWGAEKSMYNPSVLKDGDTWYAVWQLNDRVNQFATTLTQKLSVWKPQDYPYVVPATGFETNGGALTVLEPVLTKDHDVFIVTFKDREGMAWEVTSTDFRNWSKAQRVRNWKTTRIAAKIDGESFMGNISKAPWSLVDNIINKVEATQAREAGYNESMRDDATRFANLKEVSGTMTIDPTSSKAISKNLIGIFFEDINYAADGGLYAELVQNRDFEYCEKDNRNWNHLSYWKTEGDCSVEVTTEKPIHQNNSHYIRLTTDKSGGRLINEGFDGMSIVKGEKYNVSAFIRGKGKIKVSLIEGGKVLSSATLKATDSWIQQKVVLKASATSTKAQLAIEPMQEGTLELDFISVFPQNTYKGRTNGMRKDLAQVLADMHPRFIRFPGGCLSHGNGLNNMYHWKNTIGPLWERKGDFNIWNYHQSLGLGFYEYFQFCEDIGAEPLPVLPAGVPCQNSSKGGMGQQGGLPFAYQKGRAIATVPTMEEYLQELLDLIEWANGDPRTSKWAKMRADAGHPAPFNLKMLGIGNEDLISEVFTERFKFLKRGIKEKHPEIEIVGTAGPFFEGSDYEYGWDLAKEENVEYADEHYYVNPGWFIHNQQFYDKYDRQGTKVYLGEWASRNNTLENALAEALHITNLERNADVVVMSSYAPLFGREGHCQWNPDLIYFNSSEVKPSPSYYTQMLAGQNNGTEYLSSSVSLQSNNRRVNENVRLRVNSSVVRAENGDLIVKLVNLLPASVNMKLNLGDISGYQHEASLSVLTGKPSDKDSKPTYSKIPVSETTDYELPAYSFCVIRLSR